MPSCGPEKQIAIIDERTFFMNAHPDDVASYTNYLAEIKRQWEKTIEYSIENTQINNYAFIIRAFHLQGLLRKIIPHSKYHDDMINNLIASFNTPKFAENFSHLLGTLSLGDFVP
jgi:hypothetical protein